MRHAGQQAGAGKLPGLGRARRKPKPNVGEDVMAKLRIPFPFLSALAAKPYLRDLVSNYANHTAAKLGHPVMLIKGQPTITVSEERMLAERKILERGDLDKPHQIRRELQEMRAKRARDKAAKQGWQHPAIRGHRHAAVGHVDEPTSGEARCIRSYADNLIALLATLREEEDKEEEAASVCAT